MSEKKEHKKNRMSLDHKHAGFNPPAGVGSNVTSSVAKFLSKTEHRTLE
jgi:hypothetical protein